VASTAHGGRLREDFADSLSQGVFVMRKAPSVPKRSTARKAFVPLVPDETHEGMESRRDAYRASWAATDAHISRVLAEANADAFEKLERFVTSRFAEREATRRANGGAVPPHVAQQIPVGLVLAGGVNSDDHEETFEKLTRHLRERGCHTAILRSRDLRARAAGAAAAAAAVADATLEDDADDDRRRHRRRRLVRDRRRGRAERRRPRRRRAVRSRAARRRLRRRRRRLLRRQPPRVGPKRPPHQAVVRGGDRAGRGDER
jgi:hypothetical protein